MAEEVEVRYPEMEKRYDNLITELKLITHESRQTNHFLYGMAQLLDRLVRALEKK